MFLFRAGAAYGRLLCHPRARWAVAGSSVCRLSFGTLVLALLLAVGRATGSFAVAGAASGIFSVCTLSGPAKAHFVTGRSAPRRIAGLGAIYVLALAGLATLAGLHVRDPAPYLALSATAGLASPPVGAIMRARWASITAPPERRRAFALDVALEDALFLVGPLLTGGLVAADGPAVAMWVTAALFAAGVGLLAPAPRTETVTTAGGPGRLLLRPLLRPLRVPGVRSVLGVLLAVATGTGVVDVAVAARAAGQGHPARAGLVLAAAAGGSVVGGLIWGHLPHRSAPGWPLACLAGVVAATLAGGAVTDDLVVVAGVLAVNGAALSPLLVLVYVSVDHLAGGDGRALVSSWANTTFNAGAALGAAAGGAVAAVSGARAAFAAGAAVAAVGVALAVLTRRRVPSGPTELSAPGAAAGPSEPGVAAGPDVAAGLGTADR